MDRASKIRFKLTFIAAFADTQFTESVQFPFLRQSTSDIIEEARKLSKPERPTLLSPELEKLYIDKLVQLKLKEELEKHYAQVFHKVIELLSEVVKITQKSCENQKKHATKIEKLATNVQELHDHVFKGIDKSKHYTS